VKESVDSRSVSELISAAVGQFTGLMRTEVNLFGSELARKAALGAVGLGLLFGSVLVTGSAFFILLTALATWLIELGLSPPVGFLLSGIVGLLIGGVLAWLGLQKLSPKNLVPKRSIQQLSRDAAAVKEHI
jgi:hypothetical protein